MVTGSCCSCCDCCGCSTITMASQVCVAVLSMEVRACFGVEVGTVDSSDVSIADNSRSYKLDQARDYLYRYTYFVSRHVVLGIRS